MRRAAIALIAAVASAGAAPAAAEAAQFYASATGAGTTCSSAAPCTLTTALGKTSGGDTILLTTPGAEAHYVGNWQVKTPGTSPSSPLTIEPAPGVVEPVLDGNNGHSSGCTTSACNEPILWMGAGVSMTIEDLTMSNALPYNRTGGAIDNGDNVAGGTVKVEGVTFSADDGFGGGGAIENGFYTHGSGTLIVSHSFFTGNGTGEEGGAIDSGDGGAGSVTVSDSTFYNNASGGNGGAIDAASGPLTVSDSTFVDNRSHDGGAIWSASGPTLVYGSTFSGNLAEPVLHGGDLEGYGISIAADVFADNCVKGGTWTDLGYNVGSNTSCFTSGHADVSDSALGSQLGPLANNGGSLETQTLLAGNPGLGLIPNGTSVTVSGHSISLCPTTDERGMPSSPGAACNAGAYQQNSSTTQLSVAPSAPTAGGAIVLTAVAAPAAGVSGLPTPAGTVTFSDGSKTLCAGMALDASGQGVCSVPGGLVAGMHTLVASYSSTNGYGPSSATTNITVQPGSSGPGPGAGAGAAPLSVAIDSGRVRVRHGRVRIKLACSGGSAPATCRGSLSLTIKHARRRIVLGHANYAILSGQVRVLVVRLSKRGLRLLRHARHNRLRALAAATLSGTTTSRAIVIGLA
jgi:hypothetical protein